MASAPRTSKELLRLQKELKDIESENIDEVDARVKDGNVFEWIGFIKGPSGTPYENGHFVLDISIPRDYPYNPPKIKFITKIWHPNISSQTGAICLDVLKNEWSPALTIRTALLSIQALLSDPEPDDPQDAEVATMYKENYDLFVKTASLWTKTFATPPTEESREISIKKIMEMGFSEEQAKNALIQSNWDETLALDNLLENP